MAQAPVALDFRARLPATWALIAVIVLVHLGTALAWWSTGHGGLPEALFLQRDLGFRVWAGGQYRPLVASGEGWRLLTSVLLHADALHLLVNVVAVGALGRVIEPWVGGRRMLVWFLAGGAAGSLASQLMQVSRSDGASGGAFALLGAALVLGWRVRDRLDPQERRLMGPVLGAFLLLNLVLSFALPFIDAAGHLGGLVAGLVFAALPAVDGPVPWRARGPGAWAETGGLVLFAAVCVWGWAS